jgi:hypothetical protein
VIVFWETSAKPNAQRALREAGPVPAGLLGPIKTDASATPITEAEGSVDCRHSGANRCRVDGGGFENWYTMVAVGRPRSVRTSRRVKRDELASRPQKRVPQKSSRKYATAKVRYVYKRMVSLPSPLLWPW